MESYNYCPENLTNKSYICETCWQELYNFHNFYLEIEKAHSNLNILIKSDEVPDGVSSGEGCLAKQIVIYSNENSQIQHDIVFVKNETPLEIVDVQDNASCFEKESKRKRPLRKSTNDKKNVAKNKRKNSTRKEKDSTVINKLEDKGNLVEKICIDSNENSQIQPDILFVNNESLLEIFGKEDVEEVSCFEKNTRRKQTLRKSKNGNKNDAKNNSKKIFKKAKYTTVVNKPKGKGDMAEQICIDGNENSQIQPDILFVNNESLLEIFGKEDVEEVSCFEKNTARKQTLRKSKNGNKNDAKNNSKKIFKKAKYTTVVNKPKGKGDMAEQICIDGNENSQIQPDILFVNNESLLEIFGKEDVEEVSCFEKNTARKQTLRKSKNGNKNDAKNNSKKIFKKAKYTTVVNKPKGKGDMAEQICIDGNENSQIQPDILFVNKESLLETFEKEDVEEVSGFDKKIKRKPILRKNTNDTKNIAEKEQGSTEIDKPEDEKKREEIFDIEGEYGRKEKKLDANFSDQNDSFESDDDPSSNSVDSSKLEHLKQNEDKFISENLPLTCALCQIPFSTFDIMCKHYKDKHNQRGYVSCCDRKFYTRSQVVDHINLHQNPEYFKCKICDKLSISRMCLKVHIKNIHEKRNIECDKCGKRLANESSLRTHKLVHDTDNKNRVHCEQCNRSYLSKRSLNNHMRLVHLKKNIICDLCGKSLTDRYRLKLHMLEHDGKTKSKVSCEVCGRILSDMGCLRRHMGSHHPPNGIKSEFKCPVCSKIFTSTSNLKMHIKSVHENKYVRKCTLCEKTFKRVASLKDHMANHTGNPLHACGFCPKTFFSSGNMHTHRKSAHPKEWQKSVTENFSGNLRENIVNAYWANPIK